MLHVNCDPQIQVPRTRSASLITNSGETPIPRQQTNYSYSADHRGKSYQAAPEETPPEDDDDDDDDDDIPSFLNFTRGSSPTSRNIMVKSSNFFLIVR